MLKPETCTSCPLYSLGNSFSKPAGLGTTGVIIIGEALGHEEAIEGEPFQKKAQAGSKLNECIVANGLNRNDFLLWNIIACQPPGNKLSGQWYEGRAIESCKQYLRKVVDGFIPSNGRRKILLALGNTAYRTITGRMDSVLDIYGYPFPSKLGLFEEIVTVISSLHPSYIKRGKNYLTPLLTAHIKKAVEIAEQEEEMEWREEDLRINKDLGRGDRELGNSPNNPIPGEDEDDDSVPF